MAAAVSRTDNAASTGTSSSSWAAYRSACSAETFATRAPTWDEESTPSAQAAAVVGSCESRLAVSASRYASFRDRLPCAASHAVSDSEPSSAQQLSASKALKTSEIFASRRSRSASSSSMSPATGGTCKQASAAASSLILPAAPMSLSYMCSMPVRQQNTGEISGELLLRGAWIRDEGDSTSDGAPARRLRRLPAYRFDSPDGMAAASGDVFGANPGLNCYRGTSVTELSRCVGG